MRDPRLRRHLDAATAVETGAVFVPGNRLSLLKDGPETYDAMKAAIEAAVDHVNLQTYIFEDDQVGREFADLLLARCAAGVRVNVIYDSIGAIGTPRTFFDRLVDGGVHVVEFNPVNPLARNAHPSRLNHRDHRKLLVVDGRKAFVGGINISCVYSSSGLGRRARRAASSTTDWRDTHLQVEGPVVAAFQRLFIGSWTAQDGPPLGDHGYFPPLLAEGDALVCAIGSTPGERCSGIYRALIDAIRRAERSAWLTVAYFAPHRQLIGALTDAAMRGVDVRLILPGKTDAWPVHHVGRSYYKALLKGGVRVFERRGPVMHAKTGVIDGVWATVGSANLNWRSFRHDDELNAVVLDAGFGERMEAMFAEDLAESDEIQLAQWKERPFWTRAGEWLARLVERFM